MISLDTETTGLDLRHGARPFFVTTCTGDGAVRWWEWAVDPLTRVPKIPSDDVREIGELLLADGPNGPGPFILHNTKFDFAALNSIGLWDVWDRPVWPDVRDTLLAGHLLASNHLHDLTSMAVEYLGVNIEPLEVALRDACLAARRLAKSEFPEWKLASKDLEEMPSAKEATWKFDTWLPRAVALHLEYLPDHPWHAVLRDYANADSEVTVELWKVLEKHLDRRGLRAIYDERLKLLPVAYGMEERGVTYSGVRLEQLETEYRAESVAAGVRCLEIAASVGFTELELPKAGINKSLRTFCFEVLKLEPRYGKKSKTATPTLDKAAMEYYEEVLPPGSPAAEFIKSLRGKRKRDTAVSYMEGYRRFGQLWQEGAASTRGWHVLHPSLNPTGTDTLRWSSKNPNEQNISKQEGFNLRYCFGPAPGREWWSLDAKNIEARLPAYESGEQELIALYERPDEPPYYGSGHLLNFHTVYPEIWDKELREVGLEKVGPHCKKKYASTNYQWCKNGGFAVQYGAVDRDDGRGTADTAFHKPGAQGLLKARFAKLEKLNQKCIRQAERLGYVETMPDRTVDPSRGYPLLCTRTDYGRIKPTVPLNYHIQGTACWWMGKAMVRCQTQLDEWNKQLLTPQYFIVMQVHDELVFDFPRRRQVMPNGPVVYGNLGRIRRMRQLMEQGGDDLGVPTPCSIEYHPDNWSEGVSLS